MVTATHIFDPTYVLGDLRLRAWPKFIAPRISIETLQRVTRAFAKLVS